MNMNLNSFDVLARPATDLGARLQILTAHLSELSQISELSPSPQVDGLFGELVGAVVSADADEAHETWADDTVRMLAPRLRTLCALGEGALERSWAERIATARRPRKELGRFPYLDNYHRLVRLERSAIAVAGQPAPRRIAFVGSGPLPLSAVLHTVRTGATVTCVDHDPVAADLGRAVAERLGCTDLDVRLADALDVDLAGFDLVVLAALVGADAQEKRTILDRLAAAMEPGAVLVARSARGLRALLYPPVDEDALDGFEVLHTVHPSDDVINSVVVARVREPGTPR